MLGVGFPRAQKSHLPTPIHVIRLVNQTNHFFNRGYGWLCKHCSAEDAEEKYKNHGAGVRFFPAGEHERKEPKLRSLALARWTDSTRQSLTCPRCAIQETIS